MKASDWIDQLKVARGWESDYKVAKELGFKPNTISTYRAHGTPMDESIAVKLATALGVHPAIVLADQALERAKDASAKTAWETVMELLTAKEKAPAMAGAEGWRKRRDSNPR